MNRWRIVPIRAAHAAGEDCQAQDCRRVAERRIVWKTGKRTQGRIPVCLTHAHKAALWSAEVWK